MTKNSVFLSAEWRKLALANYEVDKDVLLKYLPPFTELDDWKGKYYVSLVGFMFMELALGFETLVLVHFLGNAFLRCYQLLVSPSIVTHLLRVEGSTNNDFYIQNNSRPVDLSIARGWINIFLSEEKVAPSILAPQGAF